MKKLFLLLLLAVTGPQIYAQPNKSTVTANPEAAGVSSEKLKNLDKAMDEWVQQGWMNGGAALAIKDSKIVYYKAAGYTDLTTKALLKKDAIFRIASQSKAITSVAVMMLFEEGKLLLTDPVSKYLPAFKSQQVLNQFNAADTTYITIPATRDIIIKDLLTHTSGIGYAQIGSREANAIYAKNDITPGLNVTNSTLLDAMNRLAKLPLMHQPGARFTYGLNSDLLGCLVEQISGISLSDFFRTRIFEPLGMNDTYFTIPAAKAARLVNMYTEDTGGKLVPVKTGMLSGRTTTSDYPLLKSTYYSGGAGLSSTLYDYGIFLQMLLNSGEYNGKRLLGSNTIRMMTTNQIGDLSLGDDKFGLGFQIESEKTSTRVPAQAGTYGWGGAFATSYWVDPKEKLVLLFYRQLVTSSHNDVVEKFRAIIYGAMK